MNKFLEHETAAYSLHSDRFGGFLLVRRSDLAECYFQGDDAQLWRRHLDAIVFTGDEWHHDDSDRFDATFDHLCSGYDDVLYAAGE